MSLQYLSDNSGKHIAVVIPISEWKKMIQKHADLQELTGATMKEQKPKPSDYQGVLTAKEARLFQDHLSEIRKEWDRGF
ncbi:MAG TPA: hypothetical protein PL009_15145 [Flavipsychrobacter sp.]|nr:hypothetical protein [Flavipsychrobacter sp.]